MRELSLFPVRTVSVNRSQPQFSALFFWKKDAKPARDIIEENQIPHAYLKGYCNDPETGESGEFILFRFFKTALEFLVANYAKGKGKEFGYWEDKDFDEEAGRHSHPN